MASSITPPLRVAIVTGASRGIGAALARRLGQEPHTAVCVNYCASADAADDVVASIRTGGGIAMAVKADVTKGADIVALFDAVHAAYGGVDVVVSNAGLGMPALTSVADTSDELFDAQFAANARGSFLVLREAVKRVRDGGRIINFSSTLVSTRVPGYCAYAAAKAAVETMTAIAAKEVGGRGVTVNCVAPGPVATDLFYKGKTPEMIAANAAAAPAKRLGMPEDIAGIVAFLAGAESSWVNGQIIRVNGGIA